MDGSTAWDEVLKNVKKPAFPQCSIRQPQRSVFNMFYYLKAQRKRWSRPGKTWKNIPLWISSAAVLRQATDESTILRSSFSPAADLASLLLFADLWFSSGSVSGLRRLTPFHFPFIRPKQRPLFSSLWLQPITEDLGNADLQEMMLFFLEVSLLLSGASALLHFQAVSVLRCMQGLTDASQKAWAYAVCLLSLTECISPLVSIFGSARPFPREAGIQWDEPEQTFHKNRPR